MSNYAVWLKAFRLRTLPLALSSIMMGAFLAWYNNAFQWLIFLLCVLTTIFLQVLSNLANDYGDSVNGADNIHRAGPKRTVQAGMISLPAMKKAVFIFIVLSLASGIALLLVSFGYNWKAILFFLALGLLSIVAAVAYTVGRKPYGYMGLGDLSVFIFFGVVGVMGSYYLFTKSFSWSLLLPAMSCGVFSIAVLNINNIRDIDSDKKAGKYSIPVRIGREKAVMYHWILLIVGMLAGFTYMLITFHSFWQFLFVLTVPLFIKNAKAVHRFPAHELDPYLKQMAISTLLFVIMFGVGLVMS